MSRLSIVSWVLLVLIIESCTYAHAQATGIPPFSTVTGGPDQINLAVLSIHYNFPVFSKTGRGLPFSYAVSWGNPVWSKAAVVGGSQWSVYLGGGSTPIGGVFYSESQRNCRDSAGDTQTYNIWTFSQFQDMQGTTHPFGLHVNDAPGPDGSCPAATTSASGVANDLSGA